MTGIAKLDHLVIMAHTLDEGVAWCEATLGVTPGPGGEHPQMGTHNRLLRINSDEFPSAYLEVIAINLISNYLYRTSEKRWFDMDDALVGARVQQNGPQLIHWVASVPDIAGAVQTLAAHGIDRGPVITASRMTASGPLQWQITVRPDGQRLFDGCLPTLIQWGDVHPTDNMPACGVTLEALTISHPQALDLKAACSGIGLSVAAKNVTVQPGPPGISALLQTPKGRVQIRS
jgi:Glyoxalase-like domain